MSSLLVLRRSGHTTMPWKNGGGITREVARAPSAAGLADFDWRISIAEMTADGPFSPFPGVDRIIVPLDGEGLTLTVDGTRHRLARHQPFAFDGGGHTTCQIPAPARDLNVMTRRGRATATLQVVGPQGLTRVAGAIPLVLVGLSGSVQVRTPAGDQQWLDPLDALVWDRPGPLTVDGSGVLAAVRLHMVGGGDGAGAPRPQDGV